MKDCTFAYRTAHASSDVFKAHMSYIASLLTILSVEDKRDSTLPLGGMAIAPSIRFIPLPYRSNESIRGRPVLPGDAVAGLDPYSLSE